MKWSCLHYGKWCSSQWQEKVHSLTNSFYSTYRSGSREEVLQVWEALDAMLASLGIVDDYTSPKYRGQGPHRVSRAIAAKVAAAAGANVERHPVDALLPVLESQRGAAHRAVAILREEQMVYNVAFHEIIRQVGLARSAAALPRDLTPLSIPGHCTLLGAWTNPVPHSPRLCAPVCSHHCAGWPHSTLRGARARGVHTHPLIDN